MLRDHFRTFSLNNNDSSLAGDNVISWLCSRPWSPPGQMSRFDPQPALSRRHHRQVRARTELLSDIIDTESSVASMD